MKTDPEKEAAEKCLAECLVKLGDHFDAVQILATLADNDGSNATLSFYEGRGNVLARVELARRLVIQSDEKIKQRVRDDMKLPE